MSMTENEAIRQIKEHLTIAGCEDLMCDVEALEIAIQALEEIQQYKEIGTVQGYERAIQCSLENYNLYKEYKSKVQDYEAIGTRNDFIYFKEQNKYLLKENETQRDLIDKYEAIGTVEELKALRSDDFTEDLLNVGFTKGYNKAIDEFTERLKDKLQAMADEPAYQHTGEDYFTGICCAETVVDEIAEQLKSDEFILENIDLDERE